MANLFLNVPAPAGNGSGAAVDFSAFGAPKTIIVSGQWTLIPTINVEINNDAVSTDGGWQSIFTVQGSGTVTVNVACRWIRVTISNHRGGMAPVVNIGGDDAGTTFAELVATAGNGVGAAVDVSALPELKTVQVSLEFRGSVIIETSNDGGTTWAQEMAFSNPGIQTAMFTADFMRVRRNGVPVVNPGLPLINIGACDTGGGGGGGGGGSLTSITPAALPAGITDDYNPAGFSNADRVRQAVDVDSSSLSGLEAQAVGRVRYFQNLGPSALTLLHESTDSSAANRFSLPNSGDMIIPPNGEIAFVYDATTRWMPISIVRQLPAFNVKDYGAVGDGVTDDFNSFTRAFEAAIDAGYGSKILLPPGRYLLSQAVDTTGARGLEIIGSAFATVVYPSDDTGLSAAERRGFMFRYASDTTISGITFEGGHAQDLTNDNTGAGLYFTNSVNTVVERCDGLYGGALYQQDAQRDVSSSGDSLTVAAGVVTLVDSDGLFNRGYVGRQITIAGATNQDNNGVFQITEFVSATTIRYANVAAVTEVSTFTWTVDNGDRITRISKCHSYGCRAPMYTGNNATISKCMFEHPMTLDSTGMGDAFTVVGTTVTLTDATGGFLPYHHGKYVRIAGSTSPANDGLFKLTYISSTQISWTNAAGVAEAFTGTWWIQGGDKTGIGAGGGGLVFAAGNVTLTAAAASFTAADIGKVIRITFATTANNNGVFVISAVPGPTQATFANALGVSEAYAQGWGLDAYDNARDSGNTYGSTHAIYYFAGRTDVDIEGCEFRGIRTTCLKVSGSSLPIRSIRMSKCFAFECASLAQLGADDSQEHSNLSVIGCQAINVATGRPGWTEAVAVIVLGSKNTIVDGNQFHYTRNAITSVDDAVGSVAGVYGIQATRYVAGRSEPVEEVSISRNIFTADPVATAPARILNSAIAFERVGQRAIYGSDATVSAKVGNDCTLTSAIGLFPQSLVGGTVTLVFSAGGNDVVNAPITAVALNGGSLTFTNAGGAAGFSAGTFRIPAPGGDNGGACRVSDNQVMYVAANGLLSEQCVGPQVIGNTFAGVEVLAQFEGDVAPRFTGNRQVGRASDTAGIRLNNRDGAADGVAVAWPYIDDNVVVNNAIGSASPWGVGIGVNSGTYVDFPLLGKRGRCLTTDGKEEVVVAYGSGLVDGDTITVDNGTDPAEVYTYKTAAPAGNQFNSFAGLLALIAAQVGIDCTDYGTGFDDSAGSAANVTTMHLRIRAAAATANTDGTLKVQASALLPTALVVLPNTVSPNLICGGRGSGSAGPTADKLVVWSPFSSFEGCVVVVADNASAQALMVSDGYRSLQQINGRDGGSNTLISTGTTAGTEQYRWVIA